VPDVCTDCFNRYCWDGTVDSSTPKPYNPTARFEEVSVTNDARRFAGSVVAAVACAVLASWVVI